jgi:dethiobiotin synthetase
MSKQFIITGTGTGIGKTLTSGMLMLGLDADYWKPLQSGEETDTHYLRQVTNLPAPRFHKEAYAFKMPASPHIAAESEGITIDLNRLKPPQTQRNLLIEGAGGLMVPVTRSLLMIDLFKTFAAPIILCARTELGTINHTLLSVEALAHRRIPLHGIIFLGPENKDTIKTIIDFSKAKLLGHIPVLSEISAATLTATFNSNFKKGDF